jgi:hypothetical protein
MAGVLDKSSLFKFLQNCDLSDAPFFPEDYSLANQTKFRFRTLQN